MPRVVHVLTVPDSLVFLDGQVKFMRDRGWEIVVVTSPGPDLERFGRANDVATHAIEMPRRISPMLDILSLSRLAILVRRLAPDIVHAHTPKGGLLGMLAASIANVGARIYHMRGLPMMTATGARRTLLRETERVSCTMATQVLANSISLREYALNEGLCSPSKITVLGSGSGNGVDCEKFNPVRLSQTDARTRFRREKRIDPGAPVIGFLGRLVRDKGLIDLAHAWTELREKFPTAHLVIGGRFEPRDALPIETRKALETDPRIHMLGFVTDTPSFFAAIDVFTLPTYREGFPNVLLEASAMAVPIVATRIPGCVDAVSEGVTGRLVSVGTPKELAAAIGEYLESGTLRAEHGKAGRSYVEQAFRREQLWQALLEVYEKQLSRKRKRKAFPVS